MTNGLPKVKDSLQKPRMGFKVLVVMVFASMLVAMTDFRPLALYIAVPAVPIFFFVAWLRDDKVDAANESDMSFLLLSFVTGGLGLLFLFSLTIDLLSHENTVVRTVAYGVAATPILLIFLLWRLSLKSK
jgi:hypothetical protein